MGSLFSPPQVQTPAAPPPPPEIPDIQQAQKMIKQQQSLTNKPKGAAANLLTGAMGDTSTPATGTKTLLGQ